MQSLKPIFNQLACGTKKNQEKFGWKEDKEEDTDSALQIDHAPHRQRVAGGRF